MVTLPPNIAPFCVANFLSIHLFDDTGPGSAEIQLEMLHGAPGEVTRYSMMLAREQHVAARDREGQDVAAAAMGAEEGGAGGLKRKRQEEDTS